MIIREQFRLYERENSVARKFPKLISEWDYKKNGMLTPEMFSAYSIEKVWWICPRGHEWQASVRGRSAGNGCPYCASKKILVGFNDLETARPELAKEWNYERNYPLLPSQVTFGSGKKVWWKCSSGHEWQTCK